MGNEEKIQEAYSFYLKSIAELVGLRLSDNTLLGVINDQIVSLKMLGSTFELSLLMKKDFKEHFQFKLRSLCRELNRNVLFVDFRGDYLVLRLHAFYFKKKSVANSLKRQIWEVTKKIQRYQNFDLSSEQIALYDGYPGPNSSDYLEYIQKERHRLLDNTESNAWKALIATLLKNGPILIFLSIVFGLFRVYYKISLLPLETLLLLIVFNRSLIKKFDKIDLKAQLINGFSAVGIFLSHIYINMMINSLVKRGTIVYLEEYLSILYENVASFNKGVYLSFIFIGPVILNLSKTKREIVVKTPQ